MKKSGIILIAASFIASCAAIGCVEEQPLSDTSVNEEVTLRITANLPGDDPETRLNYFEAGKALKATWNSDDKIIANAQPSTSSYIYRFDLVSGENTSTGVFECKASSTGSYPYNIQTNAWTLYFPGSKIYCEKDYLNFAYTGQIQKGNGSLDHLKDYHSIRLVCTDGSEESASVFQDAYLDFSGEGYEESSCLKLQLDNLPSITPVEVSLEYSAPSGYSSQCFHTFNYLNSWWNNPANPIQPNSTTSNRISIRLEDFSPCTSAKVFIMMSNCPVELHAGGTLKIYVKSQDGSLYACSKTLRSNATLKGGKLHSISGSEWTLVEVSNIDGFANPEEGIVVLQEATKGSGADIIIMGDGFSEMHFGQGGNYENVMRQAYEDFFSIEPYSSLKDYFNVYYINAVSEDDHDATPMMNGAIQGTANTVFSTQFAQNSTNIVGDNDAVLSYAVQAITHKGGRGGVKCNDVNEITARSQSALMIVMINVACHAGTCNISYSSRTDYCQESSIAYCSLSTSQDRCRLTLLHEAGGHGFGKLADEYGGSFITSFSIKYWDNLINQHNYGLYRNINEHWSEAEKADGWSPDLRDTYTSESNVYWSDLLSSSYSYKANEGLGIYRGAYVYDNLYCRPTDNSIMRDQFGSNGQFFNAISRWAIWYRLMRKTESTSVTDFKSSLNQFITFDNTLTIEKNNTVTTRSENADQLLPLAPPVLIMVE